MRNLEDLTRLELEAIVGHIQEILYLREGDAEELFWDTEKEDPDAPRIWHCSNTEDALDRVTEVMAHAELQPERRLRAGPDEIAARTFRWAGLKTPRDDLEDNLTGMTRKGTLKED